MIEYLSQISMKVPCSQHLLESVGRFRAQRGSSHKAGLDEKGGWGGGLVGAEGERGGGGPLGLEAV